MARWMDKFVPGAPPRKRKWQTKKREKVSTPGKPPMKIKPRT